MTKLSFIEAEARRLTHRLPEPKRRALAGTLIALCEAHWREIRGPEPATTLAHALWAVPPPHADLLVDLLAAGDARLAELLDGLRPAGVLAVLALAEIERGDAEGVHLAYEAMMAFDTPAAGRIYAERVAAALRGSLEGAALHRHCARKPLWKALAIIAEHTGRHDCKALAEVIRLLAAPPGAVPDEALERLRAALREAGVRFLGIDEHAARFELHGREHQPVTHKRLRDTLAEVRQARFA